ncbi:arsenate reductase family protein [Hominimerdicola sp. 21CYCFAH17_S]
MLFVNYPKCTTCIKARKYLESKALDFESRHIKEDRPSYDELKEWHKKSGLELKRFFNTSGTLYKSMNLKEKLPAMTDEEKLKLLSTDGMLVKRPILVLKDKVLVGFKQSEWDEVLK